MIRRLLSEQPVIARLLIGLWLFSFGCGATSDVAAWFAYGQMVLGAVIIALALIRVRAEYRREVRP